MTDNLALVAHAKEDVRVEALPEPAPATDEAIVEIAYGGICGSGAFRSMSSIRRSSAACATRRERSRGVSPHTTAVMPPST